MNESTSQKLFHYILNDSIPADMVKAAWSGLTLPGDVYAGKVDPLSEEGLSRATDTAGLAVTGNIPASVMRKPRSRVLAANREKEHDPPSYPQRPFEADYPDGAVADDAGRLMFDIEGRPLTARYIAGRRANEQGDTGLSTRELAGVVEGGTNQVPVFTPREEIGGGSGGTFIDARTGQPELVGIANDLHPNDVYRVLGHETGHVIDQIAGNIPTEGIEDQLLQIYDTLLTGNRPGPRRLGPSDVGYDREVVSKELVAEALRAYLTAPNYIKTIGPDAAARIREYVNPHPILKKIIQFNSLGAAGALGAAGLANWGQRVDDDDFGALYRAGRGA